MAIDYLDMMDRADRHYHDVAQFHLTDYGAVTDGGRRETRVGRAMVDMTNTSRETVYAGRGAEGRNMLDTEIGTRGWLGNPYLVGSAEQNHTREEAIALFREDFEARLETDDAFRAAVRDLAGCVLTCWCQDLDADEPACHAEVIAEHANRLAEEDR